MTRRDYPFNKKDDKFGAKVVSSLIAWTIGVPFVIVNSLSKNTSIYDDEPISKSSAVVLIIIGIGLIPLFVTFIAFVDDTIFSILIAFPIGIWIGIIALVIKAFVKNKDDDKIIKNKKQIIADRCNNLIKMSVKCSQDTTCNNIRSKFYDIIDFNKGIDKEKRKLIWRLSGYMFKQKWLGVFYHKSILTNKIKVIQSEIITLEKKRIKQEISLSLLPVENTKKIKSDVVYLISNNSISKYLEVDFENTYPKCVEKGKRFFEINIVPHLTLSFEDIEFCFYSDTLVLMSANDFAIINYANISVNKSIIPVHLHSSNPISNFKVLYESWEHSCKNGEPDLRYKYNRKCVYVEIAILELNIFSEKISFAFTRKNVAEFIYKTIYSENVRKKIKR